MWEQIFVVSSVVIALIFVIGIPTLPNDKWFAEFRSQNITPKESNK